MRSAFRLILAAAMAATLASSLRAQQPDKYSRTTVFTFAPAPTDPALTEIPERQIYEVTGAKAELTLRPNATSELYLWVLNPKEGDPAKDREEFTVEMEAARGGPAARTKVVIPAKTWVRVRLPKPPAPAAPPAAVPPPATTPAPAAKAPAEEPPPGAELPLSGGKTIVTFRLLDANGKVFLDTAGNNKPYGNDFTVSLRPLSDYVGAPDVKMTPSERDVRITATVAQKPFEYPGSVPIQLIIPPQPALEGALVREGFYRRTLVLNTDKQAKANSVTVSGRVETPGQRFRIYIGIDGIDRAFGYTLNLLGTTPDTRIIPEIEPAVRVSRVVPKSVTAPVKDYPVRIEVDNPRDNDVLELRLRPVGGTTELTEIVKLDSVRDNRIWLDPAGPTDGGLLFTTRSRDWIKPLDLSHLQGNVEVYGVLRRKGVVAESEKSLVLTVDGTPPEPITFLRIAKTLEKGKPLALKASVNDPDTDVTKATFYLFRAFEDGKIPADAIKAVGTQSLTNPHIWGASIAVPADFRGVAVVAAQFGNEAGLVTETPLVQRIEIVDPLPPTGTIEGNVVFGERFQPGVSVSLRDAEGKEKAATTTDEKGRFKFERTPIGTYRLIVIKRDSSTGAAGTSPVVVEADKTTNVSVALEKIRR
jgi:hypothetical protein